MKRILLEWRDRNAPPETIYVVRRNGIILWTSADRLFTDTAPLPDDNRYEIESSMGGECGRTGINLATGEAIDMGPSSSTILITLTII